MWFRAQGSRLRSAGARMDCMRSEDQRLRQRPGQTVSVAFGLEGATQPTSPPDELLKHADGILCLALCDATTQDHHVVPQRAPVSWRSIESHRIGRVLRARILQYSHGNYRLARRERGRQITPRRRPQPAAFHGRERRLSRS